MSKPVFQLSFIGFLGFRQGLLGLILCIAAQGCSDDKSTLIAEKVHERVADFRKKKIETCRLSLLAKAEKQVDSLLLAEAQESLQDSLSRLKPFRPEQPPAVLPIDSLKVKPIFEEGG